MPRVAPVSTTSVTRGGLYSAAMEAPASRSLSQPHRKHVRVRPAVRVAFVSEPEAPQWSARSATGSCFPRKIERSPSVRDTRRELEAGLSGGVERGRIAHPHLTGICTSRLHA